MMFEHGAEVRHKIDRDRTGIVDREFRPPDPGHVYVYWYGSSRTSSVKESDLEAYMPDSALKLSPFALQNYWSRKPVEQENIRKAVERQAKHG